MLAIVIGSCYSAKSLKATFKMLRMTHFQRNTYSVEDLGWMEDQEGAWLLENWEADNTTQSLLDPFCTTGILKFTVSVERRLSCTLVTWAIKSNARWKFAATFSNELITQTFSVLRVKHGFTWRNMFELHTVSTRLKKRRLREQALN